MDLLWFYYGFTMDLLWIFYGKYSLRTLWGFICNFEETHLRGGKGLGRWRQTAPPVGPSGKEERVRSGRWKMEDWTFQPSNLPRPAMEGWKVQPSTLQAGFCFKRLVFLRKYRNLSQNRRLRRTLLGWKVGRLETGRFEGWKAGRLNLPTFYLPSSTSSF